MEYNKRHIKILPVLKEEDFAREEYKIMKENLKKVSKKCHQIVRDASVKEDWNLISNDRLKEVILDIEALRSGDYGVIEN